MFSDNYSHATSTGVEARQLPPGELSSPRQEALARFIRRADLWLAVVTVVAASWAAWSASSWLLQGWHIH